jgi:putative ABC transport system permease protein
MDGLSTHKSRSALTILGIVIGIAAIIIVMAVGSGAQTLILNQVSALGAETAVLRPGSNDPTDPSLLFGESIGERELDAILRKSNVPNLVAAMPLVIVPGNVAFEGEQYRGTIIGGSADFFIDTFDVYPDEGVPFTEIDTDSRARVVLIGAEVKEELFGARSAVGEKITVGDQKLRVVGVFPAQSVALLNLFNIDEMVLMPYTTAQTYILGTDHFNEVVMKADRPENVEKLVFDVTATIRELHQIDPGEDDDFNIQTQQGLVEQISVIVAVLTAFLTLVVGVSLVVGGIGIMNIMLVSVTERTREIGLRKALGATPSDIRRQFLFEAVILTGIGGIIGILIGSSIAFLASVILAHTVAADWSFVFPTGAAILGFVVSAGVGLVFGIYPASQAAKKSPIEALRYE